MTIDPMVLRAQNGDHKAFCTLVNLNKGLVLKFCETRIKMRASHEAEDAAQKTWLEVWRCIRQFSGSCKFSTWVCAIARHVCYRMRAKLSRWNLIDVGTGDRNEEEGSETQGVRNDAHTNAMWIEHGPSPYNKLSLEDRAKAVHRVLELVDYPKREMLVRDALGKTKVQIAAELGIPTASARTRLFYARNQFMSIASQVAPELAR